MKLLYKVELTTQEERYLFVCYMQAV